MCFGGASWFLGAGRRGGQWRSTTIGEPVTEDVGRWLRVVGQALEQIADVGEGVDAVAMTGRCHAEQDRRGLGALGVAGEQPILAADGNPMLTTTKAPANL